MLPSKAGDLWVALVNMAGSDLLDLLAHCTSLAINAVRDPHDRRPAAWAHAETLASAVALDMTTTWTATAASYFGRVSKGRIVEAVEECVGKPDADRIAGLKRSDMAEAAEILVAGKGWLPAALRTAAAQAPEPPKAEGETTASTADDDYAFAAE